MTLAVKFNDAGVNPLDKKYTVGFERDGQIKRSDFGVKTYLPLIGDEVELIISAGFERTNSRPPTPAPRNSKGWFHERTLPVWYIPHGGGPCFFMDPPPGAPDAWNGMARLSARDSRKLERKAPRDPRRLGALAGNRPTVTGAARPPLIYDYRGFPPHTYRSNIRRRAIPRSPPTSCGGSARPASTPASIRRAGSIMASSCRSCCFIPTPIFPVVQLSMLASLDPAAHLAVGRALASLRDEGVLILGSGMSYHNLQNMFKADARALAIAEKFDGWLTDAATAEPAVRDAALARWAEAPGARISHPHEDHLLPLMVAAGAAGADRGVRDYRDHVFGAPVSGYRFGAIAAALPRRTLH